MNVNNYNYGVNFQAKFLNTESLSDVVKYAMEKGKFDKLNTARKNIDKADIRTRLEMEICYTNDKPTVIFRKYEPENRKFAIDLNDYKPTNQVEYICDNPKTDPRKFALKLIMKMSNSAPQNNLYKEVVRKRNPKSINYLY